VSLRPPAPAIVPAVFLTLLPLVSAAAGKRAPVVATRDQPVEAVKLAEGHWFLDFGLAAFGNVELLDDGLRRPAPVTVHLGEALSAEHRIDRKPAGTVRFQSHPVTLQPRRASSPALDWAPPGWMRGEWLEPTREMGEVMPFRYVEIEGAPETFSGDDVTRVSWSVAFDPEASSFESSSPELDAVWELCKHSVKATSFLGIYVDGDRERRPYEADILINQLSHYAVDAHYETARHSLEHIMEFPTWPTEWRLQTPMLAWHDFLWSGDDRFIRANFDRLKSRAILTRRTDDGLFLGYLEGEPKDIIDWPANERDGYDMSMRVKSVVTAFHYRSLVDLAKMASHLGRRAEAARLGEMAAATRSGFNERLWNEERGCYMDGLDPESGRVSAHASAHANFFPLALGLVPEERVGRVADFIESRGMACSVYGAQFLIEALYAAGRGDTALDLMRADTLRSWRNMSEKVGSTITLEAWDPSLKPNLDWNHAWGAAPSNLITRGLMGIEPLQPGFKRFRIRPQPGALRQATLKSPTPAGPIHLRIESAGEAGFTAKVRVPRGTGAEFHVPEAGRLRLFGTDGEAEPRILREEQGERVIGLAPGSWTVAYAPRG